MNLREAMDILELTSVDTLTPEALLHAAKKAKKRWHPDAIAWRKDANETERYTRNFQQIESARGVVEAYLDGSYETGDRAKSGATHASREPADVIRENAAEMKRKISAVWAEVKLRKYRMTVERVVVSAGHKVSDLLQTDFDDDIAILSVISLFYGGLVFGLIAGAVGSGNRFLGVCAESVFVAQILACVLGMLPLSRYWLNERVQEAMLWFVNFGLRIFYWTERRVRTDPWWAQLIVALPVLTALILKNLLLRPMVFVAKIVAKDRMVGVVVKDVSYYAGLADWYVEQLLTKSVDKMTEEELFHLSHFYSEMAGFSQKVP